MFEYYIVDIYTGEEAYIEGYDFEEACLLMEQTQIVQKYQVKNIQVKFEILVWGEPLVLPIFYFYIVLCVKC